MSRLKRLERRNLILAGLIVALVAVVVLRPSRTSGIDDNSLDRLFPAFAAEKARAIEIYSPPKQGAGETEDVEPFVVAMSPNGQWVVRSQADYPLTGGGQDRLLENIAQMRVRKIVTTREETFAEYAGEGWLAVRVLGAGNEELAVFEIGKPAKYPEHFVRVGTGEDQRIVQCVNMSRDMAEPDITRWVEPRLFPNVMGENVQRVDIEQPAFQRTISLGLKGALRGDIKMVVPKKDEGNKDETWWMSKPKVMDANSERARDLVRSFTGARFSHVAAGTLTAKDRESYGFNSPEAIVTIWHKSEMGKMSKHKLVIGGKSEKGNVQYVQIEQGAWVFAVLPYQLSDMKRLPEEFEMAAPLPPIGDGDGDGDGDGVAGGSPDGDAVGSPDGDGTPGPVPPPAPPIPDKKPGDGQKPDDGK